MKKAKKVLAFLTQVNFSSYYCHNCNEMKYKFYLKGNLLCCEDCGSVVRVIEKELKEAYAR